MGRPAPSMRPTIAVSRSQTMLVVRPLTIVEDRHARATPATLPKMKTSTLSFVAARAAIPTDVLSRSGKVFYSGRDAFSSPAVLYVLGGNPGGDPADLHEGTIASHTEWVANAAPGDWSAYRDERWKGKAPGRHGMQPRILHMFEVLGCNPGLVPASNVVFVRSRREGDITAEFEDLAGSCWPFHKYVIENLRPKVIFCLGRTAGDFVRSQLGAHQQYATFTEQNNRRWQSHAYRSQSGQIVVVATHPSIVNWNAAETDPTGLLAAALQGA